MRQPALSMISLMLFTNDFNVKIHVQCMFAHLLLMSSSNNATKFWSFVRVSRPKKRFYHNVYNWEYGMKIPLWNEAKALHLYFERYTKNACFFFCTSNALMCNAEMKKKMPRRWETMAICWTKYEDKGASAQIDTHPIYVMHMCFSFFLKFLPSKNIVKSETDKKFFSIE